MTSTCSPDDSQAVPADAHRERALALWAQGRIQESGLELHRAMLAAPGRPDLLLLAAEYLMEQGDARRAEPFLQRAVEVEPRSVRAHAALAILRHREGRLAEAVAAARQAAKLSGGATERRLAVFRLQSLIADWRDWDELPALLGVDPAAVGASECGRQALGLYLSATDDPALQRRLVEGLASVYRRSAELLRDVSSAAPGPAPFAAVPVDRDGPLRIGYFSADFRDHPVASVLGGLLSRHDRERFRVVGIATGPPDAGPARRRIAAECDQFVELARLPDAEVARRIRALRIDVLVDLSGHTTLAQPGVLALRPARVQVGWLGFPGTLGAGLNDFLLADPWVVPERLDEHYSERLVRLPHCLFPPGRARAVADARPRSHHGLAESAIVLCSFNAASKITPQIFACWLDLLRSAPDAVLWLAEPGADARTNLCRTAAVAGVDPARVVFAPRVADHAEHLARYQVADLALDTFPYNSHATASDALWTGCPLVTLSGRSFAARVAGSLLRTAGLPEMVAESHADHRRMLHELVAHPERRREARARAAGARGTRLFDEAAFIRDLEAVYATLAAPGGDGGMPAAVTSG